jgi:hypothetical protein
MSDGGTAVQAASAEVREILFSLAAAKLGQPVSTMTVVNGLITAANGKTITYWELVSGEEGTEMPRAVFTSGRYRSTAISARPSLASIFRLKSRGCRFLSKT